MIWEALDDLYEQIHHWDRDDPRRIAAATASPLLYAMHLDEDKVAYPHARYLDKHVVALKYLCLYPDGPGGPADVYGRRTQDTGEEWEFLGTGYEAAVSNEAFDMAELLLVREGAGPGASTKDQVVFKLGIALPPRHGKSMIVTEHTPVWFLTHHPDNAAVIATYNSDFAEGWGAGLKQLLETKEKTSVMPTATDGLPLEPIVEPTRADFQFRQGKDRGSLYFRGVGGTMTGTGWGLGIIDDPFKDQTDALSVATRKTRKDWYSSVFQKRRTRRRGAPPPLQIMMFTRWHEDDLAGAFIYEEDGETVRPGWCMVRLPALAEKDDPLGRKEGQALCPQLVPLSQLLEERTESPEWFECMNQGRPVHQSGGMFGKTCEQPDGSYTYHRYLKRGDNFVVVSSGETIPRNECMYFYTMDLANSLRKTADWTVLSFWAWHARTRRLLLVDRVRDRMETDTHAKLVTDQLDLHQAYGYEFVGIEKKSFGTNLLNEMRRDHPHIRTTPLIAERDKVTRNSPAAEAVRGAKILFPDPSQCSFSVAWENEHAQFPKGKHDDQVDTTGFAWIKAQDYIGFSLEGGPGPKEELTVQQKCAAQVRGRTRGTMHDYEKLKNAMRR